MFGRFRPEIVFHAAALKHLPLLEGCPAEALKTNVWGTLTVLEAAADHGVQSFVNISTDKAANPVSVLGYSKRITERLTAYMSARTGSTYLSVRFGNVLGSRGSVLTALSAQVAAGGPVTVTDPDVSRYFMLADEAVHLVLQAAVIGRGGEVLVLDMGEPVRIADMARRLAASSRPGAGHRVHRTAARREADRGPPRAGRDRPPSVPPADLPGPGTGIGPRRGHRPGPRRRRQTHYARSWPAARGSSQAAPGHPGSEQRHPGPGKPTPSWRGHAPRAAAG